MTLRIEEMAAKARAELLRRKYTVSREGASLSIGIGEYAGLMKVVVTEQDADSPLHEFCDMIVDALNDYLDKMHVQQTKIIEESAGEFDEEVRPVTFPTFIRNAFVEARSERLKQSTRGDQ